MAEMLLNWVTDRIASSDIIDLYFVLSDLVDIPLSETELYETGYFDAFATFTSASENPSRSNNIPIGKQVL